MALISLEHVTKRYKGSPRPALDDVTVSIDRGDFVFLVGASGAGKSTFLSLLLREESATSGEIRVAGHDLRRLPNRRVPEYRREIGFVFQDYKLLMNKTVRENVAFALEVIGMRRSQIGPRVDRALKDVGLESKADKRPNELSGGEMQRVSIARAYVNQPKIILADEPTGNLDPTTSVGIMRVFNAINLTGTTVVMATHNEEIVNSMGRRVLELNEGRLVRDELNGKYDSARYFPDAQAERDAALDDGAGAAVSKDSKASRRAERETVRLTDPKSAADRDIETLEQTIHSGSTGVYGKAFENIEDTLTWGKGLPLEELRKHELVDDFDTPQAADKGAQSPAAAKAADGDAADAKFRPSSADARSADTMAIARDEQAEGEQAEESSAAAATSAATAATASATAQTAPSEPTDASHVDSLAELVRGTAKETARTAGLPVPPPPVPPAPPAVRATNTRPTDSRTTDPRSEEGTN